MFPFILLAWWYFNCIFQAGEEKYRKAWTHICEISRRGYEKVYERLGVKLEEMVRGNFLCFNLLLLVYMRLLDRVHMLDFFRNATFFSNAHICARFISISWNMTKFPFRHNFDGYVMQYTHHALLSSCCVIHIKALGC